MGRTSWDDRGPLPVRTAHGTNDAGQRPSNFSGCDRERFSPSFSDVRKQETDEDMKQGGFLRTMVF
jgi:hypothetical protein